MSGATEDTHTLQSHCVLWISWNWRVSDIQQQQQQLIRSGEEKSRAVASFERLPNTRKQLYFISLISSERGFPTRT